MQHSTAHQIQDSILRFAVEFPHFTEPGELPRTYIESDYRLYRWFPGMKGSQHPSTNFDMPSIMVVGMIPPISIIEEMLKLRNLYHPDKILVVFIDGNYGTSSFLVKISIGS